MKSIKSTSYLDLIERDQARMAFARSQAEERCAADIIADLDARDRARLEGRRKESADASHKARRRQA